jgi:hypothetical protein
MFDTAIAAYSLGKNTGWNKRQFFSRLYPRSLKKNSRDQKISCIPKFPDLWADCLSSLNNQRVLPAFPVFTSGYNGGTTV